MQNLVLLVSLNGGSVCNECSFSQDRFSRSPWQIEMRPPVSLVIDLPNGIARKHIDKQLSLT